MTTTNKEIVLELEKALESNPGIDIIDVLFIALNFKYPTRAARYNVGKQSQFKPSNNDFLSALKFYNKIRKLEKDTQ